MHVEVVDADGLDDALTGGGVVLVDFLAPWSGQCRLMAPVLEEIAAARRQVRVVSVDVEEHPELARAWDVATVPSYHLVVDGTGARTLVGAQTKPDMLAAVDEALAADVG